MRNWLGRGKGLQLGVTTCCLLAFALFGYEQGVFGPILQNENWLDLFNHPSDSETGIIVSCYNLGCLLGCIGEYILPAWISAFLYWILVVLWDLGHPWYLELTFGVVVAFFIGEKLGRRKVMWLAMAHVFVGTILQITSFHVAHLIIGRIITGVGTGLKTATVPMYQSELCAATSRGRLVSAEVLFVGVGITFAYWFNFGMSFVGGAIAWRLPVAVQALLAIFVSVLVFALPESPRWLFMHGRNEEAIEVLCAIWDKQPTDESIVEEKNAILRAIELESNAQTSSFWSIFRKDDVRTRYRVFLAWLIQMMNQVSGINMIVYYIPTVLEEVVGLSVQLSQILGGCINMTLMFATLVPSFALDRMGRRKTMMWGCTGLGLCMMIISALQSQADGSDRGQAFGMASVAFFFLYQLIFGMSVHCVPWVYVPEILPLEARTRGSALGVGSNWLWNFTVVMITPVLVHRLRWRAYLIFMATNLIFVPILYFLFPETSNIRLEDVDAIFSSGGNPVQIAREIQASRKGHGLVDVESTVQGAKNPAGSDQGEVFCERVPTESPAEKK